MQMQSLIAAQGGQSEAGANAQDCFHCAWQIQLLFMLTKLAHTAKQQLTATTSAMNLV